MKIRIYPQSLLETVWQQDKLLFTPEAAQPPLCLRCGQPLDRRLVINGAMIDFLKILFFITSKS